jgi:hypothetical protein
MLKLTCNITIVWTIDHIELLTNIPATNFSAAVQNLPKDIWHVIANRVDDHITLANFEQTCKTFASVADWEHLVNKCWSDEELAKLNEISSGNWKLVFKKLYEARINTKMYMCHHCFGNHVILSKAEWNAFAAQRDIDLTLRHTAVTAFVRSARTPQVAGPRV